MNRRKFITLLGGAVAVRPVVAHAQKSDLPVIGFLSTRSLEDSEAVLTAFLRGLSEAGYSQGKNALIEYRWANGQMESLPALAADLVKRRVAVIASVGGEPGIFAAKRSTTSIPIVFVGGSDPIKTGLVDSINRPGGNLTGATLFSNALEPKKMQLLRELVPDATTVAVLMNPQTPTFQLVRSEIEAAAASLRQKISFQVATTEQEIEQAFATISQMKIRAVVIASNPFFSKQRHQLISLAANSKLASIFDSRIQVADGGLISYGTSYTDTYRQAGAYVGRVLRGSKISDLPVLFPSKFEMAINLKTAKRLGIDVPLHIQQLADEVIE